MEVDGQGSSTECGRSSAPCLLQIPNTGSRDVTGQLEAERSRAIVNVIGEVAFLYAGCIAHVAYLRSIYKCGVLCSLQAGATQVRNHAGNSQRRRGADSQSAASRLIGTRQARVPAPRGQAAKCEVIFAWSLREWFTPGRRLIFEEGLDRERGVEG